MNNSEIFRTKPVAKFINQRDNINPFTGTPEPFNQCMISSFVIMMQWLREFLISENLETFENYDEITHYIVVGETSERAKSLRFNSVNHANKINFMLRNYKHKIPYKLTARAMRFDEVEKLCREKNTPVLIGTMETEHGHILVFDGLFQNPYGRPDYTVTNGNCKYISTDGSNLNYPREFTLNMVFREMANKKTSKTNVKRLCWFWERIKQ